MSSEIVKFIEHVRQVNEIDDVVLVGSSGGGFAALSIGTELENSCSLAYSPQSNIWDFTDAHSQAFIDATFSGKDVQSTKAEMLNRTDLVERYKYGHHKNKYIYYQNLGDIDHVIKHKKRFAESQGVRLPSGRSFNQMGRFVSELDGNGHVRPPVGRADEFIDTAFDLIRLRKLTVVEASESEGNLEDAKFNEGAWELEKVPFLWMLYASQQPFVMPKSSDSLSFSESGVPLRNISGVAFDHPVLQAQTAIKSLNNLSHDQLAGEAIRLADATLDQAIGYSTERNGAIYFPFQFPWHQDNLQPPWYSAMAQGQMLQLVCRRMNLTNDFSRQDLAERIFRSFTHLRRLGSGDIGVTHIDSEGYLWLEEYPYPNFNKLVLNGHIFALLGIYEYWISSRSPLAERIIKGALLTVQRYLPEFRNPGWSSSYNLWDHLLIRNYHQTHIMQLELLYRVTGDSYFSRAADTFDSDFPHYQRGGSLYLAAGSHVAYKADNIRVPTKTVERVDLDVSDPVSVSFSVRTKMEEEDGVWLFVEDDGPYHGLWFKEIPCKSFPKLCVDKRSYPRPRRFIANRSSIELNKFSKNGTRIDIRRVPIDIGASLDVFAKALWGGEWYLQIDCGDKDHDFWHRLALNEGALV
ncbi:D-glucuronyl C5-epimerase family protein [Limimaricola soesokkakensis]|uniref:D-glucuronyl C5-epimerase family protein n=1 Tax=Limimaricola soesokkakensis TaxID=1343159 RepID=UPI00351110DD